VSELFILIQVLIQVLIFAIFARSIISWFPIDRNGLVVRTLDAITEPMLQPLRRVIPLIGMMDITPMVAIILLFFLQGLLSGGV